MAKRHLRKGDRQPGEKAESYLNRIRGGCDAAYNVGMELIEEGLSDDMMDQVLGLPSGTFGHALNDAVEDDSEYLAWGIMVARARSKMPGRIFQVGKDIENRLNELLTDALEFQELPPETLAQVLSAAAGIMARLQKTIKPDSLHGTQKTRETLDDTVLRVSMHPGMEALNNESMKVLAEIMTSMASGGEVSPDMLGNDDAEDDTEG